MSDELDDELRAQSWRRWAPDITDGEIDVLDRLYGRDGKAVHRYGPALVLAAYRLGADARARELRHDLADFLGRPVDVNHDVLMDDVRNTAAALDEIARLVGCWSEDGQYPPTVVEAVRQAMDERWSS